MSDFYLQYLSCLMCTPQIITLKTMFNSSMGGRPVRFNLTT